MKILIIGSNGQLGSDFSAEAANASHQVVPIDYPLIDITHLQMLRKSVLDAAPQVIINCAAFTAVDDCESNPENAFELNAQGPQNLALCAREVDALLVHFSTDYVFSGNASTPYTESSETDPATVYGKSKLQGEINIKNTWDRHMIMRIAWLYGVNGQNFVKTIRRLALESKKSGKALRVVNDQVGTPTWTVNVCRQVLRLLELREYGVIHCTSEGMCSWYDFAKLIVAAISPDIQVQPCLTDQYPRPAKRPPFSVLENRRLQSMGINIMPQWQDGFDDFLHTEKDRSRD